MKPDTTLYSGGRFVAPIVLVNDRVLNASASQAVCNHSPDGFEWGYGGSGPAQLALAICLDFLEGDAVRAQRVYQDVKWKLIATLPELGWELSGKQIREAIDQIENPQLHCPHEFARLGADGRNYRCSRCGIVGVWNDGVIRFDTPDVPVPGVPAPS